MRPLIRLLPLLPVLLIPACADDGPAAPVAAARPAAAAATSVSSGRGVFAADGVGYLDCIGEQVLGHVRAQYTYRLIERATGDFVYVEQWDPQQVTGTMTGLTSGHVWVRTGDVSPMVIRSAGGGMTHYAFRSQFVSETAPTLVINEVFHVSGASNGTRTVEKWQLNCKVQR